MDRILEVPQTKIGLSFGVVRIYVKNCTHTDEGLTMLLFQILFLLSFYHYLICYMKFYYRPQLLEIVIFFCDEPNYSDGQIKCFNLTLHNNTLSTFLLLLKYLKK